MEDQKVWEVIEPAIEMAVDVRKDKKMLKSDFYNMRMKEDESMDQYAGRLSAMSVKYSNLGGTLDDAALVKKLFDTVPEHFITVIAGIEQFFDLSKLAFKEAVDQLKVFEERTLRPIGGATIDGQLLLNQEELEARQKKAVGEGSGKGKSPDTSARG
ncbi:uncharacterized protein [Setaria viridis]|uniref:uncharacterized protein n=1 Tax=Setaria viridis TaxID=4556 RepID=UPI003B3B9F61